MCDSNVILFIDEATRFVRDTVKRVITTLCLIHYKDVKKISTQILTKHAVLLSDRLIQILKYTRDLLVRVKGYMYMWCKCGAYLATNERHCSCEELITDLRNHYYCDARVIVVMNCILSPANEESKKLHEYFKLRYVSLNLPRRKSYNAYGYFYNRVTEWLYVNDESLLGGVKTICVILRSLTRYDQHVFGTITIKYQPTSKENCVYRHTMGEFL
jgi:hypothetical protein